MGVKGFAVAHTGETVEVRAALRSLRRASGLPVAFGGLLEDHRQLRIEETSGTGGAALRGLAVATGTGLGGKSLALHRPVSVTDYRSSRAISHEYDAAVSAEGLRAVLAVPVVVRRRVRGVLYGALRHPWALGERTLSAAMDAARELEQALAIRDEAQRLLAAAQPVVPAQRDPGSPLAARVLNEIREAQHALRDLAPRVTDPLLREELLAVWGRLATATDENAETRRGLPNGGAAQRAAPGRVGAAAALWGAGSRAAARRGRAGARR
ncbi:GAF domain-containing protein, partial [Streptomyces pathocidini]